MSDTFRALLKKVGSGTHTSESLNREEAALATRLMLIGEATPAQIGAFMIAHRIRRPTAPEMAGLLDAYQGLGQRLSPRADGRIPLVMGIPYDGRSRTAPVGPVVALVLAAAGVSVVQHGGRCMPAKYGVPLVELWQQLGVTWVGLSWSQLEQVFAQTGLALVYQPDHFPLAERLVTYREEIGKRPPLATVELIWSPYAGEAEQVAGFVHPPTEMIMTETLRHHGVQSFVLVKGLEGSWDLPRDRTVIASIHREGRSQRLMLHPREYGVGGTEVPWPGLEGWGEWVQAILAGEGANPGEGCHPFWQAVVWSSGFLLWQRGLAADLPSALDRVADVLKRGEVIQELNRLRGAILRSLAEPIAALQATNQVISTDPGANGNSPSRHDTPEPAFP